MCRIAAADGITTIVATPHFKPGAYDPSDTLVFEKVDRLQQAVHAHGLDIAILPGADVTVTPELPGYLRTMRHLTINKTGRYFLAEFSHDSVPPRWSDFLLSIKRSGITPILTHPERNPWFLSHPASLIPYVSEGGLVQITGMSLLGGRDDEVTKFSLFLLRSKLAHFIASDGHSTTERKPLLSEAFSVARKAIGEERARKLVFSNPEAVITGKNLVPDEPVIENELPKRKTWLQRLASL